MIRLCSWLVGRVVCRRPPAASGLLSGAHPAISTGVGAGPVGDEEGQTREQGIMAATRPSGGKAAPGGPHLAGVSASLSGPRTGEISSEGSRRDLDLLPWPSYIPRSETEYPRLHHPHSLLIPAPLVLYGVLFHWHPSEHGSIGGFRRLKLSFSLGANIKGSGGSSIEPSLSSRWPTGSHKCRSQPSPSHLPHEKLPAQLGQELPAYPPEAGTTCVREPSSQAWNPRALRRDSLPVETLHLSHISQTTKHSLRQLPQSNLPRPVQACLVFYLFLPLLPSSARPLLPTPPTPTFPSPTLKLDSRTAPSPSARHTLRRLAHPSRRHLLFRTGRGPGRLRWPLGRSI